jgi:hypothetical protein
VQPRAKIHLASDDGREFLTVAEVLEASIFSARRFKFRQHVHVAALRVEITVQHRTEQAQFADAAFTAETRHLLAVNRMRLSRNMALNCAVARIENRSKIELNAKQHINCAAHVQLRLFVSGGA